MLPPAGQTEKHLARTQNAQLKPPTCKASPFLSSLPAYLFYLFLFFETGMYIALVGLELALSARLASTSCLCFLGLKARATTPSCYLNFI